MVTIWHVDLACNCFTAEKDALQGTYRAINPPDGNQANDEVGPKTAIFRTDALLLEQAPMIDGNRLTEVLSERAATDRTADTVRCQENGGKSCCPQIEMPLCS
jgi:hypothetical protein